jgi:UDP-N-acetylbacillosamine transaminase
MGKNELKYIKRVFKSNYIAPLGEYVDKFEKSITNKINIKYALALSSGTSAIHLALKVLNINKNDEIWASNLTFIGSVAPVLYQNAKLFFIDCDENWQLSPALLLEEIKNRISKKQKLPKVLILTHLYGQMAKIDEIATICKKYNIFLIEDAAEALGAKYDGKYAGSIGDMGIFSFNGNKILTTSGAGMLVSNNKKWIEKAKFLSTQARENKIFYEHKEYGYNYRLSNVLAAIGVAQMEVLDKRVKKKRKIFSWYKKYLKDKVKYMPQIKNSYGNRWLTTIILPFSYETTMQALNDKGYESRPLWKPMHLQPLFKDNSGIYNNTSEDFFKNGLCLPSGTKLKKKDIEKISNIILKNILKDSI